MEKHNKHPKAANATQGGKCTDCKVQGFTKAREEAGHWRDCPHICKDRRKSPKKCKTTLFTFLLLLNCLLVNLWVQLLKWI